MGKLILDKINGNNIKNLPHIEEYQIYRLYFPPG